MRIWHKPRGVIKLIAWQFETHISACCFNVLFLGFRFTPASLCAVQACLHQLASIMVEVAKVAAFSLWTPRGRIEVLTRSTLTKVVVLRPAGHADLFPWLSSLLAFAAQTQI
jgi:hypothetical protein